VCREGGGEREQTREVDEVEDTRPPDDVEARLRAGVQRRLAEDVGPDEHPERPGDVGRRQVQRLLPREGQRGRERPDHRGRDRRQQILREPLGDPDAGDRRGEEEGQEYDDAGEREQEDHPVDERAAGGGHDPHDDR
jgi:hypothetical protein